MRHINGSSQPRVLEGLNHLLSGATAAEILPNTEGRRHLGDPREAYSVDGTTGLAGLSSGETEVIGPR